MNDWQGRIILFFIIGLGGVFSWHYTTSHFKSDRQIVLLNTTRPDFHQLIDLEKIGGNEIDSRFRGNDKRGGLRKYFDYFHLVSEAMPDNSDGMLMLGYLYEITGDKKRARVFLDKARRLDPSFFFIEYDLGLLSFGQGDWAQSADFLQKALALPPQSTLDRMMNSMVYRQVFSSLSDGGAIIVGLRQAYQDAAILLNAAIQKNSQGENVPAPEVHAHFM